MDSLKHAVQRSTSSASTTVARQITLPPPCEHIYHRQALISPLPPIYISPNTSLRPSTLARLSRSLDDLGARRARTPFLGRDVAQLRGELEQGMSSERRKIVYFYVLSLQDARKRAATELWLSRYKGFSMGGNGRLDFGLEIQTWNGAGGSGSGSVVEEPERVRRGKLGAGRCAVM
ncbi:hypothetical protein PZA11_008064 [Diplocarpon coronariae]